MKIYLASDHAGFDLKESIKKYLLAIGHEVEDCGAPEKVYEDDYPDLVSKAAERVSVEPTSRAIVFGKTGAGEAIVANKFKDVRAIVGFNPENVKLAREHNNANVLSLGTEFTDGKTAEGLTDIFLETPFSEEERHLRRISKIGLIENK